MVQSAVDALEKLFVDSLSRGLESVLTEANEKKFEPGESNKQKKAKSFS